MAVAAARWLVLLLAVSAAWASAAASESKWRLSGATTGGQVVEKERRRVVAASDAGTVTAADVADASGTVYRLQFITMDPGALFLPVQLHADMVFYVHSGRGKVTCIEEGSSETSSLEVERGDVYNLEQGTILYIQSNPSATRERLRIYAIFTSNGINADDPSHPTSEAYSNISDLLRGFEVEILRLGFGVPREVVEAIKSTKNPPSIIPYKPGKDEDEGMSNWTEEIFDALWGVRDPDFLNKKKKEDKHKHKDKKSKTKKFNFYSGKPDVENCYGWSKSMTNENLQSLKGSNIGMFMVNLTTGSMMGPHWNPKATEIAVVTYGGGIVQTVCPSSPSGESKRGHHREEHGNGDRGGEDVRCKNSVFRVKEGDVFVVPRFRPMAQISFNNDSFVFVGFSTDMGRNHPQFLAGKRSVLQVIGKEILALSLGQSNSTAVEKLLSAQRDSTILACVSCADELEKKAEEEWKRRKEEEEEGGKGKREREEEEEESERREQEERERKREEEERERKEQEERERKREEEEGGKGKREEEERERKEQEERERKREEEEGGKGKREEEEGGKGKREEEERERREQEERERKREEERARREQEEEERRQREKEEQSRREEEERARREQEEEERRREQEEEERRREEEGGGDEPRREEERREEEERRREEEEGGGGDEPRRREEEGGGGDEPRREEEEGEWGEPQYRSSKNLKKRYRVRKGGAFKSS